jgi:elongation factor 1-gamma
MDAADEAMAAQPKFTDPLAALPKGSFSLDGFKRVYSNEDTATKAIPYFWEHFDPELYRFAIHPHYLCNQKYCKSVSTVL